MIYSSVAFLVLFPVFCAIYWAIRPVRFRLIALLLASFGFYAYGEPFGLPLLLGVIALTYVFGLAIDKWPRRSRATVALGVALLVSVLGYFKYWQWLTGLFGASLGAGVLYLPLGLSFFTFEAIAYLVDLRRGVTTVERSPLRLGLFIAVFPHLISGPIMRPNDLIPQLKSRISWHFPVFVSGLQLFVEGLLKKVVLADPAGLVADRIFATPAEAGTVAAWVAALAYTVQIYGDFAGYTDMGRGIARMLGLELPLNFNSPYAASSITEFWRRWHMSLSSWLRDYVYVALGGNRRGRSRTYANLVMTMLVGGLWHGAGVTFIAWGGYHGILLAIERATRWPQRVSPWIGGFIALLLVINGWVLFRAHDFIAAAQLLRAMYVPRRGALPPTGDVSLAVGLFVLVIVMMIAERMRPAMFERARAASAKTGLIYGVAGGVALVFVLLAASPAPFIYFRF